MVLVNSATDNYGCHSILFLRWVEFEHEDVVKEGHPRHGSSMSKGMRICLENSNYFNPGIIKYMYVLVS